MDMSAEAQSSTSMDHTASSEMCDMKKEEIWQLLEENFEMANISLPSVLRTQTVWKCSNLALGTSFWITIYSVIHLGWGVYEH